MSEFFNRSEVEAAIRLEAGRAGEDVLAFEWEGDNPHFTLDSRGRTEEDLGPVAKGILERAMTPLISKAAAKALQAGFDRIKF